MSQFSQFFKQNKRVILLLIFFIALILRLRGINNPLLDFHSWRQTLTAMVARNFYRYNMNIFKPEVDIFPPCSFEPEFHLYTYIVAGLYKIFGVKEYIGRAVSVFFSLLTMLILYFLVKRYLGEIIAMISIGIFAVSPGCVYYSRTFMPESLMLFLYISGMYFFILWIEQNKSVHYVLSIVFIMFTFLVKITTLHLLIPILYLAYTKYKSNIFRQWKIYIFLALVIIPAFLWYRFPYKEIAETMRGSSLWNIGTDKWFSKDVLLNPDFYRAVFLESIGDIYLGFSGFIFFVYGILLLFKNKQLRLFYVWLFSIILYFLVVARGNYVHDYYQLPIVLLCAFFSAQGIYTLFLNAKRTLYKVGIIILLLWIPIYTLCGRIAGRLEPDMSYKYLADEIKRISKETDYILVYDHSEPEILYYSNRKGWHRHWINLEEIPELVKQGCKYFVTIKPIKSNEVSLFKYLNDNHILIKEESWGYVFLLKESQ